MILLFQVDRHPDGTAKIVAPEGDAEPTTEQLFRRRCYMNGITEQWKVDKLWDVERARLAESAKRTKKRGTGKRHRRKRPTK